MKQMGAGMREVQDHGQDSVCERRALDEEAFTELVHAIALRLLWTAFRIVQNWADAEDVVQSALLNAWRHAYEYRRDGVFSTWVRSILVNEARTFPRRREVQALDSACEATASGEEAPIDFSGGESTPERVCVLAERRQILIGCCGRISPEYAEVVRLRGFGKFAHAEIAGRLRVPISIARSRFHRGGCVLKTLVGRRIRTATKQAADVSKNAPS
jgi:RNA polymerase sigma-70 factor (ECF subfamily)